MQVAIYASLRIDLRNLKRQPWQVRITDRAHVWPKGIVESPYPLYRVADDRFTTMGVFDSIDKACADL